MFGLIMMLACAVLAYRYAEMEGLSGIFWAAMSVLLWFGGGFVAALVFPLGAFFVVIAMQLVLLVVIRQVAISRQES